MLLNKIALLSPESVSTALNFFDYQCTNVALSKSGHKEFLTLNPVSDPPYHFKIPGTSSFPDLGDIHLLTEMTVFKKTINDADFVPIVAGDDISVIQGLGSNFIRNMKITIGGREVFNANNLYSYKSYIDTELNYNMDVKMSHLAMTGYYPDFNNQHAGDGFEKRRSLFEDGKTAQFITKLNADIFNIDKYFLNNTDIEIEIHPHDAEFLMVAPTLLATTRLRIIIKSVKLYVLFHDLVDGLALSIQQRLEKEPAKYALRRTELKTVYLEAGRSEVNVNIFGDQIPRRIIVAMVARDDYNGSLRSSPFNFKNFSLRDIKIAWNGLQNPSVGYDLNFQQGTYTRAYYDMQRSCGYAFNKDTNGITMSQFKDGWCIFVFNLTSHLEDDRCFELIRHGTTSLHAKFLNPIPANGVTMIIYAEMDALLMIDKYRTVTTDLTV